MNIVIERRGLLIIHLKYFLTAAWCCNGSQSNWLCIWPADLARNFANYAVLTDGAVGFVRMF